MELTGNRYTRSGDWRKLLATRRGTVAVAAICVLLAAGILIYSASRYRDSVQNSGGARTVLVANGTIAKGTPGDVIASQQLFHEQSVAAKQVTAGAVADTALLHGKVAATDISPGQQLTTGDFTASGGYVSQLAPDERVISLPLDSSRGLKGVVEAGDRVDVYGDLHVEGNRLSTSSNVSALLVSNVPVLAVDQNAGAGLGSSGGIGQQSDVVLKVKASDAAALAYASDNGKVWLVLRGSDAAEPTSQSFNVQTLQRGAPSGAGR